MSGYLTNLVRRATAPEPSVRPRLPSIFGPAPASTWDRPATASEVESHAEATAPRRENRGTAASAWPPQARAEGEFPTARAGALQRSATSPLRADGIIAPPVRSVVAAAGTDHPSVQPGDATAEAVTVALETPACAEPDDVARSNASMAKTVGAQLQASALTAPDEKVRSHASTVEAVQPASTRPTSNMVQGGKRGGRSSDVPPADSAAVPVPVPRRVDLKHPASDGRDEPPPIMAAERAKAREARDRIEPVGPLHVARADLKPDIAEPSRQSSGDWSDETPGETTEFQATPRRRDESGTSRRWPQLPTHARQGRAARGEDPHDERATAAEPVIHVTIGRVEVRASMSAEPRQRTRSSTGATSLDDYLRQRSGRSSS